MRANACFYEAFFSSHTRDRLCAAGGGGLSFYGNNNVRVFCAWFVGDLRDEMCVWVYSSTWITVDNVDEVRPMSLLIWPGARENQYESHHDGVKKVTRKHTFSDKSHFPRYSFIVSGSSPPSRLKKSIKDVESLNRACSGLIAPSIFFSFFRGGVFPLPRGKKKAHSMSFNHDDRWRRVSFLFFFYSRTICANLIVIRSRKFISLLAHGASHPWCMNCLMGGGGGGVVGPSMIYDAAFFKRAPASRSFCFGKIGIVKKADCGIRFCAARSFFKWFFER